MAARDKPSRTDVCTCPEVSITHSKLIYSKVVEERQKARGQEPTENPEEEKTVIRYSRGRFLGKVSQIKKTHHFIIGRFRKSL
jgi:hypothetical protein